MASFAAVKQHPIAILAIMKLFLGPFSFQNLMPQDAIGLGEFRRAFFDTHFQTVFGPLQRFFSLLALGNVPVNGGHGYQRAGLRVPHRKCIYQAWDEGDFLSRFKSGISPVHIPSSITVGIKVS